MHTIYKALQSEDATLSSSTNLIISVIDQLKSDQEFNKFIEQFNGEISNKRKRVLLIFKIQLLIQQLVSATLSTIKI